MPQFIKLNQNLKVYWTGFQNCHNKIQAHTKNKPKKKKKEQKVPYGINQCNTAEFTKLQIVIFIQLGEDTGCHAIYDNFYSQ